MAGTAGAPRTVIIAFVLLALLATGWCIYWFTFRARLQEDVAGFRAALAETGMRLDCGEEGWSGFPFRFELTCRNLRLHGDYEGRATEVSAAQLRLYMQAYNPFHILALTDAPTVVNGNSISHALARSSLRYDTQGNWDAAIELPAAELTGTASTEMLKLFARVQDGRLQLAVDTQKLKADMAQLPPLSLTMTAETDAGYLTVPNIIAHARTTATPVTISSVKLTTSAVTIEGSGQFSLDTAGLLNGKLTASVSDLDALLGLLAEPLDLSPEQVTGARTVIGLIGGNKPDEPTKIDLIAKEGELYFGPFKFADLPPLQ